MPDLTHDELAADLAGHLRGQSRCLAWLDLPCGPVGSARPDVVAIDRSFHLRIRAFEVKISRADFLRDAAAGKWRSYLAFAESVTFASNAGLLKPADMPAGAGLIVRHADGTWRGARRAHPQPQPEPSHDFWLKLLMDGIERESARLQRPEHARPVVAEWRRTEILRARAGQEIAEALADRDAAARRVAHQTAELAREAERISRDRAAMVREYQEQGERLRQEAQGAIREVAEALGLPAGSGLGAIREAVGKITRGGARIDAAPIALESLDTALRCLTRARARLAPEGGPDA